MKRITQNLRWLVTLLAMIVCTGAWAQTYEWVETDPSELVTGDIVAIVDKTSQRAMANETNPPAARAVGVSNGKLLSADTYVQWEVTVDNGSYQFNVPGTTDYLYCTNSNNGVKIGTNANNVFTFAKDETSTFNSEDYYLKNTGTSRFLGVYNEADWRCYTSVNSNIQNTKTAIFKRVASTAPSITVSSKTIDVTADGDDGTLTVSYNNFTAEESDVVFYESDGENSATYNWIEAEVNEDGNVDYLIDENTGEARTAYFKIYALDANANEYYSELITVTQDAPVIDYATLPFTFDGGKNDIAKTSGLTQNGLDDDYGSSPMLKFKDEGTWVILKFNERPGKLTFDIKGNSFSGGTFTVQTSEDGTTYTDLASYTELGNTQSEEFNNLGENVRYIRWIYTEKASGNVALGNIALAQYEEPQPSITVSPTTIDVPAAGGEGTINVTYQAFESESFEIKFYESDGVTPTEAPNWIGVNYIELIGEGEVNCHIDQNGGDARSAYFKVVGYIGEGIEPVYSELITVTQAAAPQPYIITITPNDNATINAFYYNNANVYNTIRDIDAVMSGTKVFVAVDANDGYEAKGVTVTDGNGENVTVTKEPVYDENIDPVWSFTMPASDVTVSCTVEEILTFEKVTSINDLFAGGEYIIVNEDNSMAMSTTQKSNNRGATQISFDNNNIATINDDTQVFTLEGNSDGWYFNTGSGYIYAASSSSNHLKTQDNKDDNAKATITISNGSTSVVFNRENGRNTLQYNPNNGNPIFTCYASASQQPIQLYKKVGQEPETTTVPGTLAAGKFATRIFPFVPEAIEGITFYSCAGMLEGKANTLALTEVSAPEANVPYILENTSGAEIDITQTGVDTHTKDTYEAGLLMGVFADTEISSGYVLQTQGTKQSFYKVAAENPITVPPYRAYLNYSASVKSIGFDTTTAINTLEVLTSGAYEGIYTVDGKKLNRIQKGVNILKMADGSTRKVIVK